MDKDAPQTAHHTYLCLGGPRNGQRHPGQTLQGINGEIRLPKMSGPDLVYRERWLQTDDGRLAFWLFDGLTWVEGFAALASGRYE